MSDRAKLILNLIVDVLAVYGIIAIANKYMPELATEYLPNISLEKVSIFVLVLYILKIILFKDLVGSKEYEEINTPKVEPKAEKTENKQPVNPNTYQPRYTNTQETQN